MLTVIFLLLVELLAVAAQCLHANHAQKFIGTQREPNDHHPFITFTNFRDQVKHAKFEDYKHAEVYSKEEFETMKAHILRMYEGIQKPAEVTSFLQGQRYGDCIGIKEQPTYIQLGLKEIAEPPANSTPSESARGSVPGCTSYADSPLKQGLKDRFGNPISCPTGSIPMARLTLERLTGFRTLGDFFAKVPRAERSDYVSINQPGWEDTHLHAFAFQNVDNFGGNSWLDLWSPTGDFSLSQHWYMGGSGCDFQTVEGGWQVIPSSYKTDQAVLFIYWNNHNYNNSGCFTQELFGCYNLDCPGFQQVNHNWFLGGIWDHYSTNDNVQWGFEMQWKLYQGNWWLWLKGPGDYEAVGYYPTSIYNGGQLSKQATTIQYGGEVARLIGDVWPQMGSGRSAERGWEEAAFQNTIFWIPRDESGVPGVWANLTSGDEALPVCYTIELEDFPDGGGWGTNFYFGGPGAETCD